MYEPLNVNFVRRSGLSQNTPILGLEKIPAKMGDFSTLEFKEGGGNDYSLDLYLPSSKEKFSLVIFIHGGLWLDRDKSQYNHIAKLFVSQGMGCVLVNYPLSSSSPSSSPILHPTHIKALKQSVEFVISKKNEIDYDSIILFGHSCGAHMASLLLLSDEYRPSHCEDIKAVVGIEGLYDLPQFCVDFPQWASYVYYSMTEDQKKWDCPISHTWEQKDKNAIRWLIMHSPEDDLVNEKQAQLFTSHLQKMGFQNAKMETDIKGGHFEVVEKLGGSNEATSKLLDFLKPFQ